MGAMHCLFLSLSSVCLSLSPFSWGGQGEGHSIPRVGVVALGNALSSMSVADVRSLAFLCLFVCVSFVCVSFSLTRVVLLYSDSV